MKANLGKSAILFSAILLITALISLPAQNLKHHKITITGTSTLHDWESEVKEVNGSAAVEIDGSNIKEIKGINLNMTVNSIESGKSKMNNNMYEALKAKQFPTIKFVLNEVVGIDGGKVKANGNLEIAGVKKPVVLEAKASVTGKVVTFQGSYTLKMTDYNVEPPVLMLGTLKTGNEVTVNYDVAYQIN